MILTLGKYNKYNNMNYIESIQGKPLLPSVFYGVTIRTPLKIGPCDAFSFYKPKPPIK